MSDSTKWINDKNLKSGRGYHFDLLKKKTSLFSPAGVAVKAFTVNIDYYGMCGVTGRLNVSQHLKTVKKQIVSWKHFVLTQKTKMKSKVNVRGLERTTCLSTCLFNVSLHVCTAPCCRRSKICSWKQRCTTRRAWTQICRRASAFSTTWVESSTKPWRPFTPPCQCGLRWEHTEGPSTTQRNARVWTEPVQTNVCVSALKKTENRFSV